MTDFLSGMDKIEQVATNRNRKWVFEKLKEKNITKVEVRYSGGHDSGGIESIIATLNDESFIDFDESIVPGTIYNVESKKFVHPEMTDEQRLVYLITKPVYDNYYSFNGEPYVDGILTWDVVNHTISDYGTEEVTQSDEYERELELDGEDEVAEKQ
jgi:hypothetical protein